MANWDRLAESRNRTKLESSLVAFEDYLHSIIAFYFEGGVALDLISSWVPQLILKHI